MKKIYMALLAVLAVICLAGCSMDYTKEDADKLLKREGINNGLFGPKADYVSEEQAGDDTVYRYRDKKTGEPFEVIEDHYLAGIDATYWDASKLFTNYGYVISRHFMKELPKPQNGSIKERFWNDTDILMEYGLSYTCGNEKELKEAVREFNTVMKKLRKKRRGCRLAYIFEASRPGEDPVTVKGSTKTELDRKQISEECFGAEGETDSALEEQDLENTDDPGEI